VKQHRAITLAEYTMIIPEASKKTLCRDLIERVENGFLDPTGQKRGRK
jgi:hypothetical protein